MAGFVRRQEKKTRLATKGLPASSLSQMGLSSNEYSLVREVSNNSEENEIVGVPISALPVADTPDVTDVVPGVQSGTTKKFSLSSLFGWISGQITAASIGAVPNTRTVNGKALSSDITLSASDVSAIPTSEKGANGGVATLGNDGKVPSAQLPAIASTAADVTYDNTNSGLTADDVQEAIDELAAGGSATGKADESTIAPTESSTTASAAHPLGSIFYLSGVLYRALADIAIGGTINTGTGGNATQTTVAQNFKRTVTLTSAQYSQLSAAEKAADIVYIVTDEPVPAISTSIPNMDGVGSAGSTGEVADAGHTHPTDTSRVPVNGMGENLLENWYFLNPVNQRGATSGSNGYCISRWKASYGSGGVSWSLTSDGLSFQPVNSSSYGYISQLVDSNVLSMLVGKRIHVHAITSSGDLIGGTIIYAANALVYDETYSGHRVRIRFVGNELRFESYASALVLRCAKFELGSEQTLAHLEGSTWVLNEIPDYEAELLKCQTSTADSSDTYANKTLATEQQLAYVETGSTASRAYAVGEYFCWGGLLYRAITAISSGASFTVGTNCEQLVGGGMNDIGTSISTIAAVSGNTTIQIGGYYKIGYVVIFTVAIQASKNLASGDNVCQGLPGVRANNVALRFYNHTSQTFGDAILVNTGVITLKSSVSSGQSIRLIGAYIA